MRDAEMMRAKLLIATVVIRRSDGKDVGLTCKEHLQQPSHPVPIADLDVRHDGVGAQEHRVGERVGPLGRLHPARITGPPQLQQFRETRRR